MNILRSFIVFVLIILLFSGCGSVPVTSLKQDQDILTSTEAHGYLVLGINTDFRISSVEIDGKSDFVIDSFIWSEDRNYFIAPVPKGKYTITRITLSSNRYYDLDFEDFSFSFDIKPNSINYVGELRLKNGRDGSAFFELINRSSLALEFLELKYPTILSSKKLIYQGPGEDSFFNLVTDNATPDGQEDSL